MCSKNIEILGQQQIIGPVKLRYFSSSSYQEFKNVYFRLRF